MTPFESAFVMHLVGDWLLQNNWMATNKMNLRHPAGWVHAAIHGVLLGLVLGWLGGLALGVLHLLIDTRVPLRWWDRVFARSESAPVAGQVQTWADQVIHISLIALWLKVSPLLAG